MSETTNVQDLEAEDVRKTVAGHYAQAVEAATSAESRGGCCSVSTPADLSKRIFEDRDGGAYAQVQGYSTEELDVIPAEAVQASFGCGDPVSLAGLGLGDTVVDLGSGAGIDVILAARRVGPTGHVIGIDMTDEMLESGRANIAEAGLDNAEMRKGIIEDMPVDTDSVDWILSNCVINLSPEKPRVFAEAYRVLKPGGQFMVSDIVVGDIPEVVRETVLGYVSCVGGAVGEDEYLRIIRDAGFTDVEIVARHVYSEVELLSFAGFTSLPEGDVGDMARQLLDTLEDQIVSIKVRGRKTA